MANENRSSFDILNGINVNGHVEQKNIKSSRKDGSEYMVQLSYLSWAWAWAEVKKAFPDASYTIYENKDGLFYHTDGRTAWVKTGVTIGGLEHIEYLPVMDNRNKSIPLNTLTSFDVNKAIQRSLTKACARHGLGLYIYAGEDLPEADEDGGSAASKGKSSGDREKTQQRAAGGQKQGGVISDVEKMTLRELVKKYNFPPDVQFLQQYWPELNITNEMYGQAMRLLQKVGG